MTEEPSRIEDIDDIVFEVEARPWKFAIDESEAIDRHWSGRCAANPHLFNGRVFLNFERRLETQDDRRILKGAVAPVDFKAFLAWRDFGFPDRRVRNCFAMAALLSADGVFVLGRMSDRTANAGKIYFAAGTPDFGDVRDDALDLEGSVARELLEETGIGADEVSFAPGWTVVFDGPRIACMKLTRSPLTASEISTRFQNFLARQKEPELVALPPVLSVQDLDDQRMPGFVLHYLRRALSEEDAPQA